MTHRRRASEHRAPRLTTRLFPSRRARESAFEWLAADPVFERVAADG